jgi:DNA invertase Pin-like site-specific DNA recombinase
MTVRHCTPVAPFERWTRAGVKAAHCRGVKFGRKPTLTQEQVALARALIRKGESRQQVAGLLNVSRSTL